ncbi:uncharacterized protein LOC127836269 isoform X1 [Dreissena polymorpha]|uniref:uncharacterized protein LOC127836269 isoform X1 n=1 Tax=Dreissena polymorpha TaxID=45954 RepID=UPI0022654D5C|nr:uncharacterized protein LOC127836269 isoform X1 [Dreissena polymorpha]
MTTYCRKIMAIFTPNMLRMLLVFGLAVTLIADPIDNKCYPCVCISNDEQDLYRVDCRFNEKLAGRLPQFKYINESQIIFLNISGTSLYSLTTQTQTPFENYSSLQELDLYNTSFRNNTSTLKCDTFKGLEKLEFLNIAHNEDFPITNESESNMFVRLKSLKKLIIYQNNFVQSGNIGYPGNILKHIPTLEELWIDGFSVAPLGKEFRNLSNLTIIRISGDLIRPIWQYKDFCAMQTIDDHTFENLLFVRNLSIINCGVQNILNNSFIKMTHLRMLDLSMNDGLNLSNITGLKSLNSELEVLILDNIKNNNKVECPLSIMKSTVELIQHLNALKMLSLDHNKISDIDKDAFEIFPESLEHVRVRRNKFELGYYLLYVCRMPNLRKLEASVTHLPMSVLQGNYNSDPSPLPIQSNRTLNRHIKDLVYFSENSTDAGHFTKSDCPKPFLYYIPTVTITAFLPPKLEYIDLSHSKIGFPIYDFYIDKNNSLKTVIASNSLLYCWAGPVHGVEKVEIIDQLLFKC